MAIPDYQACMLPLLQLATEHKELRMQDATEILSDRFGLSESEHKQLLPSGSQRLIANRVGWARTYLVKAGLLGSPRRGAIAITLEGQALLQTGPTRIDNQLLRQYSSFQDFIAASSKSSDISSSESTEAVETHETPEESMDRIYQTHQAAVLEDLRERILTSAFAFFEQLVVDLVLKLGYGGTHSDAGMALGRSGDEGLDGVIKEDRLGLEVIYLQAKRWKQSSTVGRPDIQKFVGALQGRHARKGIFITTSTFSSEAIEYATSVASQVVLVDGNRLLDLMWETNLGLHATASYNMKKLDLDYLTTD